MHAELKDQGNELWLSPVSTWEVLSLSSKGQIRLPGNARDWVAGASAMMGEAPLTHKLSLRRGHCNWRIRIQPIAFLLPLPTCLA